MLPTMQSEPLRRIGIIVAGAVLAAQVLIGPGFELLAALNVTLSPDLQGAVEGLLRSIVAVLGVWGVVQTGREQVYAQDTTQAIANRAAVTGDTDIGKPPTGPFDPDQPTIVPAPGG